MVFNSNFYHLFIRIGTYLSTASVIKLSNADKSQVGGELQTTSKRGSDSRRQIVVDGYELKMVQILFRHGARTPLHIIEQIDEVSYSKDLFTRKLPYTDINYETVGLTGGPSPFSTYDQKYANKILKGGAVYGVLTTTGQEQSYVFGRLLKKQYIDEAGFIDDIFNPDQVYVRSTNSSRTIDTARCVLAGMFGHRTLNKLPEPLKIHVDVFRTDPLIPRTAACHVLHRINRAARLHGADLPELQHDRRLIERLFGMDTDCRSRVNFVDMHDDIVVRETHGFGIPVSLQPHREMVIRNAIKLKHMSFCGQHEAERDVASKLSSGPLVTMLVNNIDKTDATSPRLYLLSCHDSTLVAILGGLGLFDDVWPPFTADLRFELYENREKQKFVRVSYNGQKKEVIKKLLSKMSCHDSTLVAILGGLGLFDDVWPPFTADLRFELYENREKQKFVRVSYNGQEKTMTGVTSELCPLEDFKRAVSSLLVEDKEFWDICDSDILEIIAKELVEAEKTDAEDEEIEELSDIPAGM